MKRLAFLLSLGLPALGYGADVGRVQIGVHGGVAPAEPIYTYGLVGGWIGVGGRTLRLDLSGAWQDGLESRTQLSEFLEDESLLDGEAPVADRTLWSAEGVLRVVPLRGKFALLQSSLGDFAFHFGFGGGVRAQEGPDSLYLAPNGLASLGADLHFGDTLLVRFDTRGFALVRRDRSLGLGAELLVGLGAQLW